MEKGISQRLIQAFATDGYDVNRNAGVKVYQDSIGMAVVFPDDLQPSKYLHRGGELV